MLLKFKSLIRLVWLKKKVASIILGTIVVIVLGFFIWPKVRPSFWWSVIFENPLKQTANHTNFLLLGVSGGDNAGSDLTDTMIFISVDQKTGKATLVSLLRDIWSTILVAKINTAYHYGEEKEKGGGLGLARQTVEEITGLPIHYVVKIDMAGLKEIIDLLGGIKINIGRSFDDYKFPIAGKENDLCDGDPEYKCRYQHIHFDQGVQILNGERALQYIRSRDAEGDEGTDFARSARQQNLILALKNEIVSPEVLLQPQKILTLNKIMGKILETDIPKQDFPYVGKLLARVNFSKLQTLGLEKFLINPPQREYEGQWVLVPRSGDFNEIYTFLREQILK